MHVVTKEHPRHVEIGMKRAPRLIFGDMPEQPQTHDERPRPAWAGVYTARGPVAGEDWAAVASAINERMAALRIGQQELAQLSGVSVSTVRHVQHGAPGRRVQNKTLAALSCALGWPDEHLSEVLLHRSRAHDTGPAPERSGNEAGGQPPGTAEFLRRIEARLAEISRQLVSIERAMRDDRSRR
jgi:transcriptional regulator with XRE-family HTH domain